jgi:phosphate transport system substrate-binding protein
MAQKNETTTLVLTLLITLGLVGGGFWWFTQRSGAGLGNLSNRTSGNSGSQPSPANTSTSQSEQANIQSFADVQNVPSGLFSYGGSTSWAPLRLSVDSAVQAARPEFRLRYVEPTGRPPSSGAGISMLVSDRVDFAQSSRPILDQEYNQAQQRGYPLKQIPVALDGLAVAVNPSLNISGLTLDQLKSIYMGRTTNWQELGGPDRPIIPFSRPTNAGGTVELFVEDVLTGQAFGANVKFVDTTTQALRELANNSGAIYYASAPEVVPQCTVKPLLLGRSQNELVPPYQEPFLSLSQCPGQRNRLNVAAFQSGQYPLTRKLFVVVKQTGSREQQAGEAYANLLLTGEGQKLISAAGFVSIR